MGVPDGDEHGELAEDAVDRLRVAALEQGPFVLEDEAVELVVAGNHRWRQEQVGLEHSPVPKQYKFTFIHIIYDFLN